MANQTWDGDTENPEFTDVVNRANLLSASIGKTGFDPNLKAMVGLCASCQYYRYAINDVHQLVYSACGEYEVSIGRNLIKNCSHYRERNSMSLNTMYEIATLIDVPKDAIGFIKRN